MTSLPNTACPHCWAGASVDVPPPSSITCSVCMEEYDVVLLRPPSSVQEIGGAERKLMSDIMQNEKDDATRERLLEKANKEKEQLEEKNRLENTIRTLRKQLEAAQRQLFKAKGAMEAAATSHAQAKRDQTANANRLKATIRTLEAKLKDEEGKRGKQRGSGKAKGRQSVQVLQTVLDNARSEHEAALLSQATEYAKQEKTLVDQLAKLEHQLQDVFLAIGLTEKEIQDPDAATRLSSELIGELWTSLRTFHTFAVELTEEQHEGTNGNTIIGKLGHSCTEIKTCTTKMVYELRKLHSKCGMLNGFIRDSTLMWDPYKVCRTSRMIWTSLKNCMVVFELISKMKSDGVLRKELQVEGGVKLVVDPMDRTIQSVPRYQASPAAALPQSRDIFFVAWDRLGFSKPTFDILSGTSMDYLLTHDLNELAACLTYHTVRGWKTLKDKYLLVAQHIRRFMEFVLCDVSAEGRQPVYELFIEILRYETLEHPEFVKSYAKKSGMTPEALAELGPVASKKKMAHGSKHEAEGGDCMCCCPLLEHAKVQSSKKTVGEMPTSLAVFDGKQGKIIQQFMTRLLA